MSPLNLSLADLINHLDEELPDATDLARIREARLRSEALHYLGDQLVSHYVGEAKHSGASWSEIGDALGVSKQAAQQRHTRITFGRYTDLARHSIVLAQEAARTYKHAVIGTEHMLLGLLGEPRGLAYQVLVAKTESEQCIRDAIEEAMPPAGRKAPRGHIEFGPQSKRAIEQAIRAAADLGHDWVGTEHALLGLIRVEQSPAAQILRNLGFGSDELHETVRTETANAAARDKE